MTGPSTSRRRFLASGVATAGTALAGCVAPTKDPLHPVERWAPASLLDPRFRAVHYVDAAAIRSADLPEAIGESTRFGRLGTAEPWGFDASEPTGVVGAGFDAESVDWWLPVGWSGILPRATVAGGDFDPDRVADRLTSGRWLDRGTEGDRRILEYQGQRVIAVGEERAYAATVPIGEDSMGPVRSLQRAADGTGRYATREPAYDALCDAVGEGQFVRTSSVTEPLSGTDVQRALFEGLVTRGVEARVVGDSLRATFAVVFGEDAAVPVDAVREWAGRLDAFDWTRVDVADRTVEVTAGAPVDAVPVAALTWDRLFTEADSQTSSR